MEYYIHNPCNMYDLRMLVILLRLGTVRGHGRNKPRVYLWRSNNSYYSRSNDASN